MTLDTYSGIYSEMRAISAALFGITGDHPNTTFTFKEYSGGLIQDDYGNWVTDTTPTEVAVTAKMVEMKDPKVTQNPGIDETRTYLEGFLISPRELDGNYYKKVACTLTQNNVSYSGSFTFSDAIPSALTETFDLHIALGQKVHGYFERNLDTI